MSECVGVCESEKKKWHNNWEVGNRKNYESETEKSVEKRSRRVEAYNIKIFAKERYAWVG